MSLGTTVLIVDDHEMMRSGLRMVIEGTGRMEVVGEASNGEEAIRLAEKLEPDVILMDISMPGMDGIEATRRITALGLGPGVLILTRHDHVEYLEPIMSRGRDGVRQEESTAGRADSIDRPDRRREDDNAPEGSRIVHAENQGPRIRSDGSACATERQGRKILELTARGFTARQIASKVFLASKTVENYRARLKTKLGVDRRSDLVALALKAGLLQDDQ